MLEVIEKLLILQERDRKILQIREELAHVPYEKEGIQTKHAAAKKRLDDARLSVQKLEAERKEMELEVEAKKGQIEKYSLQQFQTKKNEEYQALAKEIAACRSAIVKIEDGELDLMEKSEQAEKKVQEAKVLEAETKKTCDSRMSDLNTREAELKETLAGLESNREELAADVEEGTRNRYERLMTSKGTNVVVGIQHGVCGGCHMQLNRQVIVSCQAEQELMSCPQCGRLLYFTPDMDLATAE